MRQEVPGGNKREGDNSRERANRAGELHDVKHFVVLEDGKCVRVVASRGRPFISV